MNHPQDTGAFTTVSGMIGGVVKAISVKPVMMAITFSSLANVMIYAAAYTEVFICRFKWNQLDVTKIYFSIIFNVQNGILK